MKKFYLSTVATFLILSSITKAQDITISFSAEGATTTFDQITATNLSTNESVTLGGTDVLILHPIATNIQTAEQDARIKIVPNPINGIGNLYYSNYKAQLLTVQVSDISGKIILKNVKYMEAGSIHYELSTANKGIYLVSVISSEGVFSIKFAQNSTGVNLLRHIGVDPLVKSVLKASKADYTLNYNDGDIISYKVTSGNYTTIINEIPTETKTITARMVEAVDGDGNYYTTVKIDEQLWFGENLKTTKYNDGTDIPLVTDNSEWSGLSTPGYCWYNNDELNYKDPYGALYNWHTVDTDKLCPDEWYVPTENDWDVLTNYLGGESIAGGKLKEPGLLHWSEPNRGAINETLFTAVGSGLRSNYNGSFDGHGIYGYFWSSTEVDEGGASFRGLINSYGDVTKSSRGKSNGFSVRCVREYEEIEQQTIYGQIELPININPEEISIVSTGGICGIESDNSFKANATTINKQFLFAENQEGEMLYASLIDDSDAVINANSTARTMVALMPWTAFVEPENLGILLDEISSFPEYQALVNQIQTSVESNTPPLDNNLVEDAFLTLADKIVNQTTASNELAEIAYYVPEVDYLVEPTITYANGELIIKNDGTTTAAWGIEIINADGSLVDGLILPGNTVQFPSLSSIWGFLSSGDPVDAVFVDAEPLMIPISKEDKYDIIFRSPTCSIVLEDELANQALMYNLSQLYIALFKSFGIDLLKDIGCYKAIFNTLNNAIIDAVRDDSFTVSFFMNNLCPLIMAEVNSIADCDKTFNGNYIKKIFKFIDVYSKAETVFVTSKLVGDMLMLNNIDLCRQVLNDNIYPCFSLVKNETIDNQQVEVGEVIKLDVGTEVDLPGEANNIYPTGAHILWETNEVGGILNASWTPVDGNGKTEVEYEPTEAGIHKIKAYVKSDKLVDEVIYTVEVTGNNCEETGTVTDASGNTYKTVKIGTQWWMAENLAVTNVPLVTNNDQWAVLTTPAYCWYDNDASYKKPYGALYNWYAVESGKLCPSGWHVPSDADWTILIGYLGGATVAGGKLKETGTAHWRSPNIGATNETCFTAVPGGIRHVSGGAYIGIGTEGYWWTTTQDGSFHAMDRWMSYEYSFVGTFRRVKRFGFSVRCVRD
ncbi:FISUMP domain-containing protein [Carboxylicivirga sp. N1Y90]|uniref:FISUMP domain-containing protein n=1 Tax=Carboxylicivirga fragile TaxID=3417571 RepID=UPI003D332782|nr:T9SS type A sorting domain-containing protein [Marinilabiliaceae bacterium N1Y90]